MSIYCQVTLSPKFIRIKVLFASDADGTIINQHIVNKYHLPTKTLSNPICFWNADKSINAIGTVTHKLDANFIVRGHSLPNSFCITNLGRDDALLEMPWFWQYNPTVDWVNGTFILTWNKSTINVEDIPDNEAEAVVAYTHRERIVGVFTPTEAPLTPKYLEEKWRQSTSANIGHLWEENNIFITGSSIRWPCQLS